MERIEKMQIAASEYTTRKGIEFRGADVYKTTGKKRKLSKFMASYHRKRVREQSESI